MRAQWKLFADAYIGYGFRKQTRAAIDAGYSERSAYNQASRLMKNDEIRAYIKAKLAELGMGAEEVLVRLAEQARAEYSEFFKLVEIPKNDDCPLGGFDIQFDFEACKAANKLHLIKQVKHDRNGNIEVHFHDAQSALVNIGRHHSIFKDRTDITSGDEKIDSDDSLRENILRELSRIADASETSGVPEESDN